MSRQRTIAGEVIKTTPKAVLVELLTGGEHWIPRRVCLDGDVIDEGDTDLIVAEWFCEKEGIE